jgi:hypothetical protein
LHKLFLLLLLLLQFMTFAYFFTTNLLYYHDGRRWRTRDVDKLCEASNCGRRGYCYYYCYKVRPQPATVSSSGRSHETPVTAAQPGSKGSVLDLCVAWGLASTCCLKAANNPLAHRKTSTLETCICYATVWWMCCAAGQGCCHSRKGT